MAVYVHDCALVPVADVAQRLSTGEPAQAGPAWVRGLRPGPCAHPSTAEPSAAALPQAGASLQSSVDLLLVETQTLPAALQPSLCCQHAQVHGQRLQAQALLKGAVDLPRVETRALNPTCQSLSLCLT